MTKYFALLYHPLVVAQIHEEVRGFKTFVFENGHNIIYKPGQYLTLVHQTNFEEIRRSYSITSTPFLNEPLRIGVKRIDNGFLSRQLIDHTNEGDVLWTTGAGGFFILPENISAYKQVFFLAAGSGITPIFSLIRTALFMHLHLSVVLIYSSASPGKTIFYPALQKLREEFAERFNLQFLFSNAQQLREARLSRELLATLVAERVRTDLLQTLFYTCGPESYMRLCMYTLQEERVPKENIRKENFVIQKTRPPKLLPPDVAPHCVTIYQGKEKNELNVVYPDSILQAAKKSGINLPYSCETGKCGSCAAKIISGKIWLSYNEVLTEKDLDDQLTLTCVGHPVEGDVVLRVGNKEQGARKEE